MYLLYGKVNLKLSSALTNQNTKSFLDRIFPLLLLLGIVLNAFGLFNEILEPDGTLYATIAKHMAQTNDWVNLIGNGSDWLDKPHFPFWITALSFKIFGVNAFAYKLPSFLFWLLGIYYTYLLAVRLYNKTVAQLSVIIYITALHVILSNFDVRAEGYLTTLIIAATYHILYASEKKFSWHIVYAALYCGCAMMTKGIFVLVTIASGFIFYWIITKQWKEFAKPKWYLLFILSFLFTLPELYCLYVQFDLHPEKIVYGKTHVSGLRFFFWDSQFGRFMNTGPIKGKGNPLFFFHTILWAFLPWSLLLYVAVINLVSKIKSSKSQTIVISISALATFLLFSLSRFQLPYYIAIIFPHFSILTASWMMQSTSEKKYNRVSIMFTILFFVLVILSLIILIELNAVNMILFILITVISIVAFFIKQKKPVEAIAWKAICFSFLLSAFLNISFYPTLMHYQAGMQAGRWFNEHQPLGKEVTMYKCVGVTSFTFYSNATIKYAEDVDSIPNINSKKTFTLFGDSLEIDSLKSKGFNVKVLATFTYFHTSKLSLKFINPKTRSKQLQTFELADITKQ